MSWLEQHRSGIYHVAFRVGEARFKRSLGTKERRKAEALAGRIDENLALIERGRLVIPGDADVVSFLLTDGKISEQPERPKLTTLKALFDDFLQNLRAGSVEDSTLYGMKIHIKHLKDRLGSNFRIQELGFDDLQNYVHHRSQDRGIAWSQAQRYDNQKGNGHVQGGLEVGNAARPDKPCLSQRRSAIPKNYRAACVPNLGRH